MLRIIGMNVVCFVVLGFFSWGYADDDVRTYETEETVVTATKQAVEPEKVPQAVTVITPEEIRNTPAYNVGEMLDLVPGVRIIRAGSVGASNGVSIRSLNGGPSSNKTLVLVDGRPVNDAWTGGVNWHAIPMEMVDRVEVMRGPGSALYGSQASGGVISVFTRKPAEGFHGWLSIRQELNSSGEIADTQADGYGRPEIRATKLGLNGTFGGKASSHFVSLGYRDATQSFPTPTENTWDNYDLMYTGNYEHTGTFSSQLSLDIHRNAWDYRAERSPYEDANDSFAGDYSLKWQTGRGTLNSRLYLNRLKNENTVYGVNLGTGTTSRRVGVMTDYTLLLSPTSLLIFGLDTAYDTADVDYEKTVVNMTYRAIDMVNIHDSKTGMVSQVAADTYVGTYGANSRAYDQHNIALFAQYSRDIGEKLSLVAGGRYDFHSEFGTIFNPKAGFSYELFEQDGFATNLKVNYGTAFRAPPMWGIFSQSLDGYGNADLKPEKTQNTDIGIFQRLGDFGHAELTLFHMDVTDLLINDKLGTTGEGYFVFVPTEAGVDTAQFNYRKNLGSYSPKGVELGFNVKPHSQLTIRGSYTYLDPGDFTFQTSRNRYNIGVGGFIPLGDFRIEGEMVYNYTGDGYFFDYEARPFDAFGLTGGRLTLDYQDRYRISLYGNNLTDETYQLWHYAWQPGRTIMLALEAKI